MSINKIFCLILDQGSKVRNCIVFVFKLIVFGLAFAVVGIFLSSCKKLVEIDPPVNSITTEEAFGNDDAAITAVSGIYTKLINTQTRPEFASSGITLFAGLSADEFKYNSTDFITFSNNLLTPDNNYIRLYLWTPIYSAINKANACIEGLSGSKGVSPKLKNQLLGEAKFLRAFCYFYLANLYGDVPMTLSTDWKFNATLSRTQVAKVYEQIISDLEDAKGLMVSDYSFSNNERIRANKWAAIALLSRVYLYSGHYQKAEDESTSVIGSSLFSLNTIDKTFSKNNNEAILQFQPTNKLSPYAIPETYYTIPQNLTKDYSPADVAAYWQFFVPDYELSNQLLNSFETGDQRKSAWTDTTGNLNGKNYYYSGKYKVRLGTSGGNVAEYYMVLRLAEQYLIRAEARAQQDKITEGASDLNSIRLRAGLLATTATDKLSLLDAIEKERQVELFAEWGHRWFDLKRLGKADAALSVVKGSNWQSTDQLFPLPFGEIQKDPNLTQNPGY